MADQGPGKGDGPADMGRSVKFSTQTINDSQPPRPDLNERLVTESSLPPHQREAINTVPVTPGIALETYEDDDLSQDDRDGASSPNYFSQTPGRDTARDNATTPDLLDDDMAAHSPEGEVADSMSGHDILRRMSQSHRGRRETVGDVMAAFPSLPLSGNAISATFNMPHSLKYRKGADWVSAHPD